MSAQRFNATAGKTRACPHCKATILDSAQICPACRHHLRFGPQGERQGVKTRSAFRVEGVLRQPSATCEYSLIASIRDARGQEIKRQVIDVGAMTPNEPRTFEVSVEISAPQLKLD